MNQGTKSRLPNQFPRDDSLGTASLQVLDQILAAINNVVSQGPPPPSTGLQSIQNNSINPTTAQIVSSGNRTGSITTSIAFTSTTTSITFYWDGTNGSLPFKIYRDDGSVVGPIVAGSPLAVTGLSPSTTYFFYFYWDEVLQKVTAVATPGVSVGTPPIAYTAGNPAAAQQAFLRTRIPLGAAFTNTGITTPASGTGSGSGGAGGGSGGGSGCPLSGAPVRLWGPSEHWSKTVEPNETFVQIATESGRYGLFSPNSRLYCQRGLLAIKELVPGDMVLTEDGEERAVDVTAKWVSRGKVDHYHATKGHIYSAWGFVTHNFKTL